MCVRVGVLVVLGDVLELLLTDLAIERAEHARDLRLHGSTFRDGVLCGKGRQDTQTGDVLRFLIPHAAYAALQSPSSGAQNPFRVAVRLLIRLR